MNQLDLHSSIQIKTWSEDLLIFKTSAFNVGIFQICDINAAELLWAFQPF